jgi:hypothetical protein
MVVGSGARATGDWFNPSIAHHAPLHVKGYFSAFATTGVNSQRHSAGWFA